jgi:hypothetical protein
LDSYLSKIKGNNKLFKDFLYDFIKFCLKNFRKLKHSQTIITIDDIDRISIIDYDTYITFIIENID